MPRQLFLSRGRVRHCRSFALVFVTCSLYPCKSLLGFWCSPVSCCTDKEIFETRRWRGQGAKLKYGKRLNYQSGIRPFAYIFTGRSCGAGMPAVRFHWTTERDQMILIVVSPAEFRLPYQSADRSLLLRFVSIRRQPPSATHV